MKKIVITLCPIFMIASTVKGVNYSQEPQKYEGDVQDKDQNANQPQVFADISEAAQEAAVKFGGMRVLLGTMFSQYKLNTGLVNKNQNADHKMNIVGLTLGGEYSKSFHKNFLLAMGLQIDWTVRRHIEGSWGKINPAYEDTRGRYWSGDRSASVENSVIVPSIFVKGGYLLRKYSSAIFLKLTVSQIKTKYKYMQNGTEIGNTEMKWYSPSIGLGAERKFNSKWGTVIEANFAVPRKSKKNSDYCNHQVKLGKFDARIMATLTLKKDS